MTQLKAMILIIIICIIAYYIYDSTQTVEGYSCIEVDTMMYSESETHPEKKNRPIATFQLPLPLKSISAPQKNSSAVVRKELNYLSKLILGTKTNDDRRMLCLEIEQKGVLSYFINYAGTNGLIYDEIHLKKVNKDVETLAYLLKSYYNRPRPYQLGFVLGININPVITASSSSYPCEQTMISKMLAYQLSYINPSYKEQLHGLAKKIELSRYYGGMNFPSDTVAALKVCDILRDRIKYSKLSISK
jgi:hypothetical protein